MGAPQQEEDNLGVVPMPPPPQNAPAVHPAAQDAPAAPTQPQIPSLTDLYVKLRSQGLSDANAALALAQANRKTADLRSGFREASSIASGRPYDATADRAQLMAEADRPLSDLAQQRQAGPVAAEEVGRQQNVIGSDISMQQAAQLRDPGHPVNVATRSVLGKLGMPAPAGLTAVTMPPQLWATVQPLVEKEMAAAKLNAEAPGRAAGVQKTQAETANLAGPGAALQKAEAEKAQADAAHTRMLTGGEVVPGFSRGGIPIDEGEAKKINDEYEDYIGSKKAIDEILKITGDNDFILNPKKRAELQPRLATALGQLRGSIGMRSLAGPEMEFASKVIADPTQLTLANATGYSQNRKRFQSLESILGDKWNATVKAKDLRSAGTAPQGEMVDVISPDGKSGKIPAANLEKALQRGFKRANAPGS